MPVLPGKCQYSQKNTSVAREMPGLIVNSVNHQCCQEKCQCCQRNTSVAREMPVLPEKHQCCQKTTSVARKTPVLPQKHQYCLSTASLAVTQEPSALIPLVTPMQLTDRKFQSTVVLFDWASATDRKFQSTVVLFDWFSAHKQKISKHCSTIWLGFSSQTGNFKAL